MTRRERPEPDNSKINLETGGAGIKPQPPQEKE